VAVRTPVTLSSRWRCMSVASMSGGGDVGRVAVKNCFKLFKFLHLYLLFYYNFLTVLIMRVGMFNKGINFNSGLNIYGAVVFSDRDCL